jgi:glycosyltransferase involved in cell wall biosynthesis
MPRIVAVVPCLDEALTIGGVVQDLKREVPGIQVVVVDNGSGDGTASVAAAGGATVLRERRRGKGHAVRRALRTIDADVYLLIDGDGTYPVKDAARLLQPILDDEADVVIGGRLDAEGSQLPWLNRLGNRIFLATVNTIFGARISDLLTGYRAMSREFVRRSPILSTGFEIETELTVLALERGFRTVEVPVQLARRPAGSHSKIRVARDGLRILNAIFTMLRDYRPLTFFGGIGLAAGVLGLVPGAFVTWEFTRTGQVRIPTAVLATGLEMIGFVAVMTGVILTTLARRFREIDYQVAGLEADIERAATRLARERTTDERRGRGGADAAG